MKNLFVYGTLMNTNLMESFIGETLESDNASLKGFKCGVVNRAHFPGITPSEGDTTEGKIFYNVPDFRRLDSYEGVEHGLYSRETVVVEVGDAFVEAEVYVFQRPELITDEPWRTYYETV